MFSLLQIILDLLKGLYNSAGIMLIISAAIVAMLYILCNKGMVMIAWVIVLTPLLFTASIAAFVLYKLKLSSSFGEKCNEGVHASIINDPLYKHGYTHEYKYTTTPVKVRVTTTQCNKEEEEDSVADAEVVKTTKPVKVRTKSRYLERSDPEYESFLNKYSK
jgi:hypothetical protein